MFNYAFIKTLDVLYIESDDTTNEHFSSMLEKQFKEVYSYKKASDAIARYKENKDENYDINIIICNDKLEDMCGLKLLKEIRSIDKKVPVIITTDKIELDGLSKAIEHQATDYLEKPINAKDLVFSIQRICEHKYYDKLKEQTQKDLEDIREVINEVALVTKTNLDDEIVFVNKYFCEISGFTQEEVIGQTHDIIRDEGTNSIIYENIKKVSHSGNIWEGKLKNKAKNDEEFYVYLTVIPILKDNEIEEFMYIGFLATEDEIEQKSFKKKVAQNIHESRRINTEAREKIDQLLNKLSSYKNMEINLIAEKERSAKFASQIKFYEKEVSEVEERLKETSEKASVKIKKVLADEKETREKKEKVATDLDKLTKELDIKNSSIKALTKELDEQVKIIEKLMRSIDSKENAMGMN